MMKTYWLLPLALIATAWTALAAPVHTTYLWHLEQPIYWPAPGLGSVGYQTAWQSIQLRSGGAAHPENDVTAIFSLADRVAAYQFRPRDAIAAMTGSDAGAQVTYTGGLVRNVASLGAASQLGYGPNWNGAFIQARAWPTSGGRPRLEMTVIPYHHALAPLVDPAVLKKEIQIYQHMYGAVWGQTPARSTGFFPPELAFSTRIIPVLAECGITWSFVPSNHLSRAVSNFPLVLGTGGENCDPPNPADQVNPPSANWFSMTISRGCTPTDAVPFSYQPHYARYIDAETGGASQVVVIPVAMAMSWQDGYQTYGVGDIHSIAAWNDPARPMMIALGHDGDNAFGGGYSYYMESVPSFTQQAVSAGYEPTTVPEFLADHPPLASDIVHVEDGAWVNADGDFGSPDFINWNWPPYNMNGQTDIENGWALDVRNWAVITAATNRVLTAEAVAGGVSLAAIQNPEQTSPAVVDLAWHFLLGSLNSGYMYYGNALDLEMKPALACNLSTTYADQVIGDAGDPTPPTIWALQQQPHNPGGVGFGAQYGYQQRPQPRDFRVWTFIYDVSGVNTAVLRYRLDLDGTNPLASIQNETFAGGAEVGVWRTQSMSRRSFPAGNIYNDPEISFGTAPTYVAEQWFAHLTDPEVTDSGGVLVDYYVEAVDSLGNIAQSEIYHTFVGTGGGGGTPSDRVTWSPQNPAGGETVTILYDAAAGPLPPETNPVYIHIGHSGWQGVVTPDPAMTFDTTLQRWRYTFSIPTTATAVDFVFRSSTNQWDNNGGADWHIPVTPVPGGFVMDGTRDAGSQLVASSNSINLWAAWNGSDLYIATERAQGSGQDRFVLISAPPQALRAAPWAKAGQVAGWAAFLAEEESNGWRGWFDATGGTGSAAGSVLEGTLNLAGEFGTAPARISLCAARYATADGGALQAQAPAAVVPNGNIETSEWVSVALKPDSLTIAPSEAGLALRWTPVLGAQSYRVYRAVTASGEFVEVGTAATSEFTDTNGGPRGFYVVKARW